MSGRSLELSVFGLPAEGEPDFNRNYLTVIDDLELLGAGGGGFMLLLAPPERHDAIREALGRPRELRFDIDPRGTRIVFISDHD